MLKLYSRYQNSAGQRVRTALHYKNVPFEYISIDTLSPEEYLEINPQALMPTLDVDGTVVGQSTAMLEYIEETYPDPPLLPADPMERLQVRAFSQFIGSEMHPVSVGRLRRYMEDKFNATEEQLEDWYRHWCSVGFTALEENLRRAPRKSDFCFGEGPTWADLYLVPQVYNAGRRNLDMSPYPLIVAADAAARALPAFQAGMPENQPDWPG